MPLLPPSPWWARGQHHERLHLRTRGQCPGVLGLSLLLMSCGWMAEPLASWPPSFMPRGGGMRLPGFSQPRGGQGAPLSCPPHPDTLSGLRPPPPHDPVPSPSSPGQAFSGTHLGCSSVLPTTQGCGKSRFFV